MILQREPVLIQGVIQAAIALAVGFGLHWTGEQIALVLAFTAAVLTLITRQQVTPTAAPVLAVGTAVTTPDKTRATVVGG